MWLPVVAGAATAIVVALVQRSRLAVAAFTIGTVALGVALIAFEYRDAARGAADDARLDGVALDAVARHHVFCAQPRWRCDAAGPGANDSYRVPFSCGAESIAAAFYGRTPACAELPRLVRGYLLDENEAGGGDASWLLQVDAPRTRFPGFLTVIGAVFVCLGPLSPRLFAWARRRQEEGSSSTDGRGS
jgi:hypothetical protein